MNYKEEHKKLHKAGFTEAEVNRLTRFREEHSVEEEFQVCTADYRRLEFVRWLVTTGKLTDQVAG